MKFFRLFLFTLTALLVMGHHLSLAQSSIIIGPHDARIEGSIKYSVLGTYTTRFNQFKGKIGLDKSLRLQSVYLQVDAASLKSKHPWYDKIARSRRLLGTARYPHIIFKSDKIISDKDGYKVKGVLIMHGIRHRMIFPFKQELRLDSKTGRKLLYFQGVWNVNRKDFNIIWNKYLDHGGIVVSDIFTVTWAIKVYI